MKLLDFASLYELSNMEYIDYNSTIENRYNMKVIEFLSQKNLTWNVAIKIKNAKGGLFI
jgi:hypothetical protein